MSSAAPNRHPRLTNLPQPDAAALAHSTHLQHVIRAEIAAHNGWISFARYMELALYHPGLGYYSGGATKFGAAGDFVTAPELSSLFGQTLARPITGWLHDSAPQILEFGAGSGALAAQLLNALGEQDIPLQNYFILELSGELRARQQATLRTQAPAYADRVQWLDALPKNFRGVLLANEVLDALPVQLFTKQHGNLMERGVGLQHQQLAFVDRQADATLMQQVHMLEEQLGYTLPDGYVSELCNAAPPWLHSIAASLQQGVALLIDYGFPTREYYHPQRSQGTLMCHYRHHAHGDPFLYPGLQDITAHVDFSVIAHAAESAGLELLGYTSQARALINAGITELATTIDRADMPTYLATMRGLQTLLSESEMGELFKVITFAKRLPQDSGSARLLQAGLRHP